jgi:hypothetical protein
MNVKIIFTRTLNTNPNSGNEFKLSDVNMPFNVVFHMAFLNKTKTLQCKNIYFFLPHDTHLVTLAF